MKDLDNSQYRIRKIVGILGISLPIMLYIISSAPLYSISHYYYTEGGVFFIGILSAFGLVLIAYEGYPIDTNKNEKLSDDLITTISGIAILMTVLIPTRCSGSGQELCYGEIAYLFGHDEPLKSAVHLLSAGIFLLSLGWMSLFQFTKSKNVERKNRNKIYRYSGYIIFACIALLVIIFSIEKVLNIDFNDYLRAYTFILEAIAVWAFGFSWIVKGEVDTYLTQLMLPKVTSVQ